MTSALTAWFRLLCSITALAILVGCGGAPSDDGGTADVPDVAGPPPEQPGGSDNDDDGQPDPPVDRAAQHDQSMSLMASSALGCASCHSAADGQSGGLNLETGSLEELAARLVGRRSASDNCTTELLIDPENPGQSLFLGLITPHDSDQRCVSKMPIGSNGVSEADYEVLETWVEGLIATYNEQDDGDFDVGGGGGDDTSGGFDSSEAAVPADPLVVLSRAKYLIHGAAVTDEEYAQATNAQGQLRQGQFEQLVRGWLATDEFRQKREDFFTLAFQQNPPSGNYVRQLGNSNRVGPGRIISALEQSINRTAERIYSDQEDFRSVFWTNRHEVTTTTLLVLKMLDNPLVLNQLGRGARDTASNMLTTMVTVQYGGEREDLLDADVSDWRTVELRYDPDYTGMRDYNEFEIDGGVLGAMRGIGDEGVATFRTPRVLCSTPPFFQLWETNADNRFRAQVSQCMIMALGRAFNAGDPTLPDVHPLPGVDLDQTPEGSECLGCHKNLDPMVSAFEAHFDYSRNRFRANSQEVADFYTALNGERSNFDPQRRGVIVPFDTFPEPYFSFKGVNEPGEDLYSVVRSMATHPDFATGWVAKVCQWVNSVECDRQDPELQRIADVFVQSGYRLDQLFETFFTSKLVTHTNIESESNYPGAQVSVSRRDHFCHAVRVRMRESRLAQDRTSDSPDQNTDVCARNSDLARAIPSGGNIRGATGFNLATSTSAFASISIGNMCSTDLNRYVGNNRTFRPQVANAPQSIELMVTKLLGFPTQTEQYTNAYTHLMRAYGAYRKSTPVCSTPADFSDALKQDEPACGLGLSDTESMQGVFSQVCQSPSLTILGF